MFMRHEGIFRGNRLQMLVLLFTTPMNVSSNFSRILLEVKEMLDYLALQKVFVF